MTTIIKSIFYPTIIGNIPPYQQNVLDKLGGGLDVKYGITPAVMAALTARKSSIVTAIDKKVADDQTAQASTEARNAELALGKGEFRKVLTDIQDHSDFEEADMEALGGRVISDTPDINIVKPVITEITHTPQMVIFDWIKSFLQGVIVEGSYDGRAWNFKDKDFRSPWEDTRKNQVLNVPEVRYYRFQYMLNDKPVGLYSDVIKVVCEIY